MPSVMNAYHEQWCLVLEHTTTTKRLPHSYHFPARTILGGHSTAEEPRELEEDTVADKQDLKDTHTSTRINITSQAVSKVFQPEPVYNVFHTKREYAHF